jgi:hypothetical protein
METVTEFMFQVIIVDYKYLVNSYIIQTGIRRHNLKVKTKERKILNSTI